MAAPDRERGEAELEFIQRVTAICKTLPEVNVGIDGFGHTTFKVGTKSFVLIGGGHGDEGSMSIKSDRDTQEMLIKRGPYVRTPYIGQHGWVTAFGDAKLDWAQVEELIRDAFNLAAPKRLRQ
jgi:predicted DNA-binding protein (MmcQ/YjbR family)